MNARRLSDLHGRITRFTTQDSGASPEGVVFTCPSCEKDNRRHSICVTWEPPSLFASGAVWKLEGSADVETLTVSPSINCDVPIVVVDPDTGKKETVESDCKFHGFIRNGEVTW